MISVPQASLRQVISWNLKVQNAQRHSTAHQNRSQDYEICKAKAPVHTSKLLLFHDILVTIGSWKKEDAIWNENQRWGKIYFAAANENTNTGGQIFKKSMGQYVDMHVLSFNAGCSPLVYVI